MRLTCIFQKIYLSQEKDAKILQAQAPIDALAEEHSRVQQESNADIQNAQNQYQELNSSVDLLASTNKQVET
jgi:DNA repair protein RAD50